MTRAWSWLTLLLSLLLGAAAGIAAIAVHASVAGIVLGVGTALVVIVALRLWVPTAGVAFASGWLVTLVGAVAGRPEGDYVVSSDVLGWAFVASGLVVLVTGLASARPLARGRDSGSSPAST